MASATTPIIMTDEEEAGAIFELVHVPDALTINERRALLGYAPVQNGDLIVLVSIVALIGEHEARLADWHGQKRRRRRLRHCG